VPDSLLYASLEQALGQLPGDLNLAVALSGGPDSSALAICADGFARRHNRSIYFLHVHHGLHADADAWTTKVRALAEGLDRALDVRHVTVDLAGGLGVEGAARLARYQAIESMAAERNVGAVLLAHHQQDQAETVLMRLLRGSGVSGMAAMAPITRRSGLYWVRPWLDMSRKDLLDCVSDYTERTGWLPVDDPSNLDGSLARGTLRAKVIPAVQSHWPAWQQALARHAQQAAQVDRLLLRFGDRLLSELAIDTASGTWPVLSLVQWRALDPDEQVLALRVWLGQAGFQMPTDKRLVELVRQLRDVHALGHDRDLKWEQQDCMVCCIRGQLHLHAKISGFEGEAGDGAVRTK
jgi:tRNA(Ile)-lysidine synthase